MIHAWITQSFPVRNFYSIRAHSGQNLLKKFMVKFYISFVHFLFGRELTTWDIEKTKTIGNLLVDRTEIKHNLGKANTFANLLENNLREDNYSIFDSTTNGELMNLKKEGTLNDQEIIEWP